MHPYRATIMKALVSPVATYGYESWTLTAHCDFIFLRYTNTLTYLLTYLLRRNEETRLAAFEMKGLRKILRVSWTAKTIAQLSQRDRATHELLRFAKLRSAIFEPPFLGGGGSGET